MQIPRMWHKTHIIALLKPGKTPTDAKHFYRTSMPYVQTTRKNDTKQSHADNRRKIDLRTSKFPVRKELQKPGIIPDTAHIGWF